MEVRSGEVELILKEAVKTSEDIAYVLAAAEAGLLFVEHLDITAAQLRINRGTLSRWILP